MIHEYVARLERVLDGDTFDMLIDLGFGCFAKVHIRVLDYNAPELSTPHGVDSRYLAEAIFSETKQITVRTYKDARSFERWLAEVFVDGVKWSVAMEGHGAKSVGATPLDHIRERGALLSSSHVVENAGG
jgi:endonuclease YncB( thermonuclease family)